MRIVIELKQDAVAEVVLNNLYKMTPLQESFGVNMLAIVDGRPQMLSLQAGAQHFIEHRREVVTRRTLFELREARDRMHIVEGLEIAVDNIDAVIELIRSSKDTEAAKAGLMSELRSVGRARRRRSSTCGCAADRPRAREADAEIKELGALIDTSRTSSAARQKLMAVIVDELEEIKSEFGDERRTEIVDDERRDRHRGPDRARGDGRHRHPRRLRQAQPHDAVPAQGRGGRGITGAATHEEDFVAQLFVASTHDTLLLFTNKGRAYSKKVYELPQAGRTAKGKAIVNVLELQEGERVVALLPVREFSEGRVRGHGDAPRARSRRPRSTRSPTSASRASTRSPSTTATTWSAVRITEGASDVLLGTRNG